MMPADSPYVVVDTNVFVYIIVGSPIATQLEKYLVGKVGLVSFQTVASLRWIALRRKWGLKKITDLESRLKSMAVVPSTDEITSAWAQLMNDQMLSGSRIEIEDAWIAATALVFGCPVLTNDRKDFERIVGLTLLPPAN